MKSVLSLLNATPGSLFGAADNYLFGAADTDSWPNWLDNRAVAIAFIIASAWLLQRIIRRVIRRTIKGLQGDVAQRRLTNLRNRTPRAFLNTGENITLRRAQRAETIGNVLRSASAVVIFVIALFAILRQFDLRAFGGLIAGASIATAALGFGAQNIVRDFLAGFFIVIEDQYGVGDVIDVGKASGTVEGVSLRVTRIRDADGRVWHIPNGEIKGAGNLSQQWSRAVIQFRLHLDSDITHAIKVMKRVADEMHGDSAYAGIITEEAEIWGPEAIDADGILIKVAVKTRPLEQWHVSRTLRSRIKKAFDEERIAIATAVPAEPEPEPKK